LAAPELLGWQFARCQFPRRLFDRMFLTFRSRAPSTDVLDLIGPHVEADALSSIAPLEMSDLKWAVDQDSLAPPESRGVFGLTTGNVDPEPLRALFPSAGSSGSNLVHRDPELRNPRVLYRLPRFCIAAGISHERNPKHFCSTSLPSGHHQHGFSPVSRFGC
jgi:hypothetical protein